MRARTISKINGCPMYEAESIEQKVRRIVNNNEPITDGAPMIYTERKDGVLPAYDIRTDRWDVAMTAMDAVNRSRIAQRDNKADTPADTPANTPADIKTE